MCIGPDPGFGVLSFSVRLKPMQSFGRGIPHSQRVNIRGRCNWSVFNEAEIGLFLNLHMRRRVSTFNQSFNFILEKYFFLDSERLSHPYSRYDDTVVNLVSNFDEFFSTV